MTKSAVFPYARMCLGNCCPDLSKPRQTKDAASTRVPTTERAQGSERNRSLIASMLERP